VKRFVVFLFVSVLFAGAVFAQNRDNRLNNNDRQRDKLGRNEDAQITVEGVLRLEKGVVAVASGDNVYIVPMLNRYIGFIDGLKEGTKVSFEGAQFKGFIRPVKVTINGKIYDFPENSRKNDNSRFSQGRGDVKQPRNLSGRGRQSRPFSRGGFGNCCR